MAFALSSLFGGGGSSDLMSALAAQLFGSPAKFTNKRRLPANPTRLTRARSRYSTSNWRVPIKPRKSYVIRFRNCLLNEWHRCSLI
ncbi:hypothetical protein Pla52o_39390 [Novipirellula galeiformis]|uniref:Uncharacterized protein n=1 Tax=Novipirellula galeiformis TaxID=2528004 RepID=A0A5C6CCC7_9BACT|nr:hypothetical protein Pla52o_39390 [Novipirellula galeiformis]